MPSMKSLTLTVQKLWPCKVKSFKIYRSKFTVKVTRSKRLVQLCSLITTNAHMKYESSTSNGSKVMAKVKVFRYVGQMSRSQGHRNDVI